MFYGQSKKKLMAVIAIALVIILLAAMLGYIAGRLSKEKSNVIKSPDYKDKIGFDGNGKELIKGKIYDMSEKIMFTSSSPLSDENAITLKATVYPSNAQQQMVDWNVSWNKESSWTARKEAKDYVSVAPESDGSLTAKVNCLQAFNEQIAITVSSRVNENITTTCIVDYTRRLKDMEVYFYENYDFSGKPLNLVDWNAEKYYAKFEDEQSYFWKNHNMMFTDGTVNDVIDYQFLMIASPQLISFLENIDLIVNYQKTHVVYVIGQRANLSGIDFIMHFLDVLNFSVPPEDTELYEQEYKQIKNRIRFYLELDYVDIELGALRIIAKSSYSNFQKNVSFRIDENSLKINPENLTLDKNSLVF